MADKNLRLKERIAILINGVNRIKKIAKIATLPIAFLSSIVVDNTTSTPSFANVPISGKELPTIYFNVLKENVSYALEVIPFMEVKIENTAIIPPIIHLYMSLKNSCTLFNEKRSEKDETTDNTAQIVTMGSKMFIIIDKIPLEANAKVGIYTLLVAFDPVTEINVNKMSC